MDKHLLIAAAPTPPASDPAEPAQDYSDTARSALLWVLWHHQGSSSPVGQPIRFVLGMDQHEHLTDSQIEAAKKWADFTNLSQPAPAQPAPAQDERAAFEAWYKNDYWNFSAGQVSFDEASKEYTHLDVQLAWASWLAALSQRPDDTELLRDDLETVLNAIFQDVDDISAVPLKLRIAVSRIRARLGE